MNFYTYGKLYFFTALAVLILLTIVFHFIIRKKHKMIYSLSVSIFIILLTFTVVYVFVEKYNPAIYQSYNDYYHLRKATVYKQVSVDFEKIQDIHYRNQQLIQESDSYESFLPKTQILLSEIEQHLNIHDEMRPVAAVSILLSTFFAYGNADPDDNKVGCLSDNIYSKKIKDKNVPNLDFIYLKENRIGCCSDFAYIFSKYLKWMNYEQRIVSIGGHVLNEFKINEDWYTVDANTGLIANRPFIGDMKGVEVFYLPHFGMMDSPYYRPVIIAFRDYLDKVFVNQRFAKALFIEYLPAETYYPY